jgi:membrane peptidoglycan carboxypeptidase
MDAHDADDPRPDPTPPGTRSRRPRSWLRIVCRCLLVQVLLCLIGDAAVELFIASVDLPAAPVAPQASVLYYRDGHTVLARVGVTDHNDVRLDDVPVGVRQAVLAAEDRDFYGHWGVSVRGVLRAAAADARGGRQGASTITQQYVRNAYLTRQVSARRKLTEFALAVKLERTASKDEILGRYLNTIYYGRGAYGIAAAANAYFGVPPQRLSAEQGAVLAAVVKDPSYFDPAVNPEQARDRWKWIIAGMRAQHWYGGAGEYPVVLPRPARGAGPTGLVIDQVERELTAHGVTSQQLYAGGLAVTTSLDPAAQDAVLRLVSAALQGQPGGLRAALVAVDPATGGVRAYYGGDRGRGYFDDAAAPHPPAATFAPVALAAGIRHGIGYLSRWDGRSPRLFPDRGGVPLVNRDGAQCPDCTLEQAMVRALNTPFYALAQQIGADRVRAMALDLGVQAAYGGRASLVDGPGEPRPGRPRADIAIGRYPASVADMASVYATFAAGGVRNDRHFVESATAGGRAVWTVRPQPTRVLDERIAADVSAVLRAVVDARELGPDRPAAGKTGTQQWGNTDDNQDAWMSGYTPHLAVAVWFGRLVPGPIRDAAGRPVEGGTLPARLWRDFLLAALKGQPPTAFPAPAHVGRSDAGDAGRGGGPPARAGGGAAATGARPVVHTARTGRYVALTFDDGPSSHTQAVLDVLAQHNVTATFCVVGDSVAANPEQLRRIVAAGHAVCNHSTHHDQLGRASAERVRDDIALTDAAIETAAPGTAVPYFRAPFGDWGGSAQVAAELGHTPLGWSVDPGDWALPGPDAIVAAVLRQLTPGGVVLLHDGGGERSQTVAALRVLIPRLLAEGWTFDVPARTVQTVPPRPATSATPSPSDVELEPGADPESARTTAQPPSPSVAGSPVGETVGETVAPAE